MKPKRPPLRYWAVQDKRRIVEETFVPGASVSVVARRNDMNSNMLFRWRREYRRGEFGRAGTPPATTPEFVSVGVIGEDGKLVADIVGDPYAMAAPVLDHAPPQEPKRIESSVAEPSCRRVDLQLACGARISFDAEIEEAALRRLITLIKEVA